MSRAEDARDIIGNEISGKHSTLNAQRSTFNAQVVACGFGRAHHISRGGVAWTQDSEGDPDFPGRTVHGGAGAGDGHSWLQQRLLQFRAVVCQTTAAILAYHADS